MGLLDKVFKEGKGNGNSKPSNGNSAYIYKDIYNIFFSEEGDQPTAVESINETIEQAVDALGDNAPTIKNKDGEIEKPDIAACELIYQENIQKVAEILAGIQSKVPKNGYSQFREFYRNLLKELPLGEVDLNGFKEEIMLFTQLPDEIKKTKRSIQLNEEIQEDNAKNGKKDANDSRYAQLQNQKKEAISAMEERHSKCEENLRGFIRYHVTISDFITDVFRKIGEVYNKEGLDGAMDFTEALYFPVQEKKIPNPMKRKYVTKMMSLLEEGKSGAEINEIALRVDKLLRDEYGGKINDYIIRRSIDLAAMNATIKHVLLKGDPK